LDLHRQFVVWSKWLADGKPLSTAKSLPKLGGKIEKLKAAVHKAKRNWSNRDKDWSQRGGGGLANTMR